VSTLREFLAALAMAIVLALGANHWWQGQYGANFEPGASIDVSQVIDATEDPHGLLTF
jgi:hypothetical protein